MVFTFTVPATDSHEVNTTREAQRLGDVLDFLLLVAAGLGDRRVEIRVPRVGGVAGEGSVGLCLLGRIRPLLEYSERERG